MTPLITQCPHCRTSFNLGEHQLRAAGGLVRCGACLKVFSAGRHKRVLEDEEDEIYPEPDTEEQDSGIADDDFQTLDQPSHAEACDEPSSGAENDDFQFQAEYAALQEEENPAGHPRDETALPDDEELPHEGEFPAVLTSIRDDAALEPISTGELSALDASPVELDAVRSNHSLPRSLSLALACLLLVLLLAGQYLWFNSVALSREQPRLRPVLTLLCGLAGCELPPLRDIAAITSRELVVRSHPTVQDALQINLVFQNGADFPQDFPLLELSFTDLNNRLIANRAFTPAEYLPEDLRGISRMPPGTPVQVQLEIADPGLEAVNYSLAFRLP